jgi:16S rRNA (uracil1498-N3)-methyltransferase
MILSLQPGTQALPAVLDTAPLAVGGVVFLSGPEGGLSPAEEALALAAGYQPVNLGARTLRAETAALAALVMACRL